MSYDYLLFRPEPGADPQAAADDGLFVPLGATDEVVRLIAKLLPAVQWKNSRLMPNVRTGGPAPEFLVNAEPDGQVRSFTMSRATEREVVALAGALGLEVLDMQSFEIVASNDQD
jgi:hypothetical protein